MLKIFNTHKDKDCCNCVQNMAKQLKEHESEFALIFEKNAIILARIKEVKGDIVILEQVLSKQIFFGGGQTIAFGTAELVVSICEITEFAAPLEPDLVEAALKNLKV